LQNKQGDIVALLAGAPVRVEFIQQAAYERGGRFVTMRSDGILQALDSK
jgi:hypothetical protein